VQRPDFSDDLLAEEEIPPKAQLIDDRQILVDGLDSDRARIRWRLEAPRQAKLEAARTLNDVAYNLQGGITSEDASIPQRIEQALNTSNDKDIQGLAYVLQGEYQWSLIFAKAMDPTGRSSDRIDEELFTKAREAFDLALKTGTDQLDLLARAHSGLALLAEQQAFDKLRSSKWADPSAAELLKSAKVHYQAVIDDPRMPAAVVQTMTAKIKLLEQMARPVWIEKVAIATTRPTTQPGAQPSSPSLPGSLFPGMDIPDFLKQQNP